MRNAIHFLSGSVVVYTLMAACSAGTKKSGYDGLNVATGGLATSAVGVAATAGAHASGGMVASGGNAATTGGNSNGAGMVGQMLDPVDDAEAAPATSGTRLRAKYYIGEDGSRQFIGWRDMTRNEDCAFGKAADGKLRCQPGGVNQLGYFADPGCTQPLFATVGPSKCSVATVAYGSVYDLATCGSIVHKVTGVAPTDVYVGGPASCLKAAPPANYVFYVSAGVVAPTEFVSAVEQVE